MGNKCWEVWISRVPFFQPLSCNQNILTGTERKKSYYKFCFVYRTKSIRKIKTSPVFFSFVFVVVVSLSGSG